MKLIEKMNALSEEEGEYFDLKIGNVIQKEFLGKEENA
jgi:hypothetical protein